MDMKNAIELQSLEEVAVLEKQRSQPLESLEIIDNAAAKCQKCAALVPLLSEPAHIKHHSIKIKSIENRIALIKATSPTVTTRKLREGLAYLLKEESKRELTRRLLLYSSSATGYKWFCSSCFDKAYSESHIFKNR
jgi:hypothetical protein